MPAQKTHADAIRLFHSGADVLDAAQTSPLLCLGTKRSSTEVSGMNVTGDLAGVTVLHASAAHGPCTGVLAAPTADTLSWTPTGFPPGFPVSIAPGQTLLLEASGSDGAQKFLRVRRDTSDALAGNATLSLAFASNNALGFEDVTPAVAVSGRDEYRMICVRNVSDNIVTHLALWLKGQGSRQTSDLAQLDASGGGQISSSTSLADWPPNGCCHVRDAAGLTREMVYYSARTDHTLFVLPAGRGVLKTNASAGNRTDSIAPAPCLRIGIEEPASQPDGLFQGISTPTEEPGGITWSLADDQTSALRPLDLLPGWMIGLWIHRQIPPGAVAAANVLGQIVRRFDAV